MKRLILPLLAITALASCQPYNPVIDLDTWDEVVTYSVNTSTGEGYLSENASIQTTGDVYNYNYGLKLNNMILSQGAAPKSADLSGLVQYFQLENEENPNSDPLYTYFQYNEQTVNVGTLDLTSLKFGWLTTTYWFNFTAADGLDTYAGWGMPRSRTLYAVENFVTSPFGTFKEEAIHPGYKFTVNTDKKTIDVKAYGVKYPQKADGEDAQDYTLSFLFMEWKDIPVEFTETGIYIPPYDFDPYIDGEQTHQHAITGLTGNIAAGFEGEKRVSFKILNKQNYNAAVVIFFDILN